MLFFFSFLQTGVKSSVSVLVSAYLYCNIEHVSQCLTPVKLVSAGAVLVFVYLFNKSK